MAESHQGIWYRLNDRSKWPRSWWRPLPNYEVFLSPEEWRRHHDETSVTIRRVMLTLIAFSFFCALTLGAPDRSLLASDAAIDLPFANTKISFVSFLLIGPLVLLGIAAYLHVFVAHWRRLKAPEGSSGGLPYVFNMPYRASR